MSGDLRLLDKAFLAIQRQGWQRWAVPTGTGVGLISTCGFVKPFRNQQNVDAHSCRPLPGTFFFFFFFVIYELVEGGILPEKRTSWKAHGRCSQRDAADGSHHFQPEKTSRVKCAGAGGWRGTGSFLSYRPDPKQACPMAASPEVLLRYMKLLGEHLFCLSSGMLHIPF